MTTLHNLHARTLAANIPGFAQVLALCEQAADKGEQHVSIALNDTTNNPNLHAALVWLGLGFTIKPYSDPSKDSLIIDWRIVFDGRPVFTDAYLDGNKG